MISAEIFFNSLKKADLVIRIKISAFKEGSN